MADVVYAVATAGISDGAGWVVQIYEGDTWAADDPVVKANPGMFSGEPTRVNRSKPWEAPVEQATAAPGEKRRTAVR